MRARLGLAILIVAGVALVVAVIFVATRGRPTAVEDWELNKEVPLIRQPGEEEPSTQGPIQVSGTELTVADASGAIIWRAGFGGQIELDQQGRTARAEQVHWEFEGEGFEGLTVDAPIMTADYDMRLLHFSQGVSIEAEQGVWTFSARDVRYQFGTQKLIAVGDVHFQSGSYAAQVQEAVIDNRSKTVRLKRGELVRRR